MEASSSTSSSEGRESLRERSGGRPPLASLALFLVVLVVLDRAGSAALAGLLPRADPAAVPVGKVERALARRDAELFVFGSSRAVHHVVPSVLEAELGMPAHNAGAGGQGILFARGVEALLLEAGTAARLFVLQVDPKEVYGLRHQRALVLAPYFDRSAVVREILELPGWRARVKLRSHLYRFNSSAMPLLLSAIRGSPPEGDGFEPLEGRLDPEALPPHPILAAHAGALPDPEAVAQFRAFLRAAAEAGIDVAIILGPRYRGGVPPIAAERRAFGIFRRLAAEEGAHFLPLTEEEHPELRDPALYRDRSHLNREGAELFSRILARALRPLVDWQPGADR